MTLCLQFSNEQMTAANDHAFSCDALQFSDTGLSKWVPWASRGMYFKLLSMDRDSGRFTILIKVDRGVHAPLHRHIGAVEAFVLEGGFHYHDAPEVRFTAGSYLLEPAGSMHQPISPEGAVLLAVFHGPVEGMTADGSSTGTIDWRWHRDVWRTASESVSVK